MLMKILLEQVEAEPALSEGEVSPFLQSLFAEFYRDTWYKINGAAKWTWTRRGSRPGDSFADLCFGYALARILRNIEAKLLERFPLWPLSGVVIVPPFVTIMQVCAGWDRSCRCGQTTSHWAWYMNVLIRCWR